MQSQGKATLCYQVTWFRGDGNHAHLKVCLTALTRRSMIFSKSSREQVKSSVLSGFRSKAVILPSSSNSCTMLSDLKTKNSTSYLGLKILSLIKIYIPTLLPFVKAWKKRDSLSSSYFLDFLTKVPPILQLIYA